MPYEWFIGGTISLDKVYIGVCAKFSKSRILDLDSSKLYYWSEYNNQAQHLEVINNIILFKSVVRI